MPLGTTNETIKIFARRREGTEMGNNKELYNGNKDKIQNA